MERQEKYAYSLKQLLYLMDSSLPIISNLSNFIALLNETLDNINWVGFYLYENGQLYLGPFQGKVACTSIPIGKGVCGTCAEIRKLINVPNVHKFIGHIACDTSSNSELVLPILIHHSLYGVLDIDSTELNRFDLIDEQFLENALSILIDVIK